MRWCRPTSRIDVLGMVDWNVGRVVGLSRCLQHHGLKRSLFDTHSLPCLVPYGSLNKLAIPMYCDNVVGVLFVWVVLVEECMGEGL